MVEMSKKKDKEEVSLVPPKRRGQPRQDKSIARRKTKRRTRKVQERMNHIIGMINMGRPQHMIEAECSEEWDVKPETIREYWDMIHDEWRGITKVPHYWENTRNAALATWRSLLEESRRMGKLAEAKECLKEICKMEGFYAPDKVEIDAQFASVGLSLAPLGYDSPDEVQQRIKELQDRLKHGGPMALSSVQPFLDVEDAIDAEFMEVEDEDSEEDS